MPKSKVAAIRVQPETILRDTERLCDLAGMRTALTPGATTILKDNISWHYPFPGANTTPWQMEGTVLALRNSGFQDVSCVQNKTVVTNAFKGEDLNNYVPIFRKYGIPVLYNFKPEDMTWVEHKPKAKMHVLDHIFPDGIKIPDYFFGKNIVHLPTIKCVAGSTRVVLADGSVLTIRELAEREFERNRVLLDTDGSAHASSQAAMMAMDREGTVRPFRVAMVSRSPRNGRRMVQLRTRAGRAITTTADHRIHTPGGWTAAGDLVPGDRVGIARRLRITGAPQPLPREQMSAPTARPDARAGRTISAATAQQMIDAYADGETTTAIASRMGKQWQTVQAVLKRHDVVLRRNVRQIQIPEMGSPELWRWMGYVMAEGCVERGESTDKLWWVNSTPEIDEEFAELSERLFGLDARRGKNQPSRYIYSKKLGAFFEELGLPVPLNSGNKRVPDMLFRSPDDHVAAFLSGYLDGDGHVAARQADLSATTKSGRLAADLCILFARLGVVAFVEPFDATMPGWPEPRTYHRVTVSGAPVANLATVLTLRHPEKARRLRTHAARLQGSKQPSNWDSVPISAEAFRMVRTGLGLTQAATGRPSSVNNIENGYTVPTPRIARHFVDLFESLDRTGLHAAEIAEMRALSSEDLAWDQVESVADAAPEEDVFDVTVPGADSFVADGLVVHNCHIYTTTTGAMKNAFGGLLATHRHYTHSWIHRTLVDLLAIQKEIHAGLFAVMDGTTAGNGPGPRTMFPVVKDYMLASADQVAIDAVAAKMMGFDPMSLEYIRVAHDDGLGVGDPRDIEIVGDDISNESWGFSVGDNGASMVGDFMWFGPMKRFQKLFFHTPLVNVFIFGSEAYHDYYRWPLKDKKTFEHWRETTSWGRLFAAYERGESERILGRSDEAGVRGTSREA